MFIDKVVATNFMTHLIYTMGSYRDSVTMSSDKSTTQYMVNCGNNKKKWKCLWKSPKFYYLVLLTHEYIFGLWTELNSYWYQV